MTGETITAAECARRLGLTAQAVGLWTSKAGAPCTKETDRVMIRWPDFARWREDQLVSTAVEALRARLAKASGGEGDPISRRALAEARRAEIEVAQLEASVVPVEEARRAFAERLTALRGVLLAFPRTAAPKIVGAKTIGDVEARLEAEIRRCMEQLAVTPRIGPDAQAAA